MYIYTNTAMRCRFIRSLNQGAVRLPILFFFFKVILVLPGPLYGYVMFTVSLTVTMKEPAEIFIGVLWILYISFRRIDILTPLSLLVRDHANGDTFESERGSCES